MSKEREREKKGSSSGTLLNNQPAYWEVFLCPPDLKLVVEKNRGIYGEMKPPSSAEHSPTHLLRHKAATLQGAFSLRGPLKPV